MKTLFTNKKIKLYKKISIYLVFCFLIGSPVLFVLLLIGIYGTSPHGGMASTNDVFDSLFIWLMVLPVLIQLLSTPVYRVIQFKDYVFKKINAKNWKQEEQTKTYVYYNEPSHISEQFKKYEVLNNRKQFELWLFNVKLPTGTLVLGGPENTSEGQERPTGAIVYLNAQKVLENQSSTKSDRLRRNDSKRSDADVPGFNEVSKKDSQFVNGERVYLWHRTHLIPYRHTLSEGNDIPYLLFAGTAHLNSGDRPQIGYEVQSGKRGKHSRERRKEKLVRYFRCGYPIKDYETTLELFQADKSIFDELYSGLANPDSIMVNGAPKDSHYSLADVEEAVEIIIESNRENSYAYAVICHYKNDTDVIPESVSALLINHTEGTVDFYIELPNVF